MNDDRRERPGRRASAAAAVTALVPLRSGPESKTRLRGHLATGQRVALVAAMLSDVADALHGAGIGDVVVLAGDASSADVARALSLDVVVDPPGAVGLNEAVMAASALVRDVRDTMVVMPDLPSLGAGEITALLRTSAPVAIAPSADGGTGGLLRRRGVRLGVSFGQDSASHHALRCLMSGVPFEWCPLPGFADDVDTPKDLWGLDLGRLGPATARLLGQPAFGRPVAEGLRARFGRLPTWWTAAALDSASGRG